MHQRKAERVRAFLGAQVIFNNHNSTLDCHIRNISAVGAKLAISPTVSLPEEFDLYVPQKGRTFRARLRWRIDDSAGVEFADAQPPLAAPRSTAATDRLQELETENAALRAKIRELNDRLSDHESATAA